MHRRPLLRLLARFEALHPGDGDRVGRVRALVEAHADCLLRSCLPGHVTASAWILSPDHRRFLLTQHRKLGRWLQLGGHADGETSAAAVALREALEESGLSGFSYLGPEDPALGPLPVDVDVHAIPARAPRDGRPAEPAHDHHDLRFALVAGHEAVRVSDESVALRWFEMDDLDAVLRQLGADPGLLRLGRRVAALLRTPAARASAALAPATARER